jgi:pyruvate kinase
MSLDSNLTQPEPTTWKTPDIMATVGPTLETKADLRRAIESGAGWMRLPCGYRQRPHVENAQSVQAAAAEAGIPVQLLLDLPSSRPRTGRMTELRLAEGDRVVFWDSELAGSAPVQNGCLPVPLPGVAELAPKLAPRQRMWFCDGRINFVVDEIRGQTVVAQMVLATAPLKSSNSLFLPDNPSVFSPITGEDRDLLKAFAAAGVVPDWIALSLIASPADVCDGRKETRELLGKEVRIMAKFETEAAVDCAEAIIAVADGIMVARGDLGLAVGYMRLPETQERLVEAARRAGKVAVVATQVLEGFAETGIPQRAELSDLSLIVQQRADVVMLGKETVFSPRPIECICLAREVMAYEAQRRAASLRLSSTTRC